MVDFQSISNLTLKVVGNELFSNMITPMFVNGETIIQSFQTTKTTRYGVIFTNKRIFIVNVQGLTGTKKEFTSLPYSKIQVFSIETAGLFDADCELDLVFSGLGKVKFEFMSSSDIVTICKTISNFVL